MAVVGIAEKVSLVDVEVDDTAISVDQEDGPLRLPHPVKDQPTKMQYMVEDGKEQIMPAGQQHAFEEQIP